jgi:membrane protease YdiL (CAAX protease family)
LRPSVFDWAVATAVTVSPLAEEAVFRGAVLPGLVPRLGFFWANSLTALLFLGAHVPGWAVQGRLLPMLQTAHGGALSIFLMGWILGVVVYKSSSVSAGILAHLVNNLFSL